jgi:Ca-activated chloride channel homolog
MQSSIFLHPVAKSLLMKQLLLSISLFVAMLTNANAQQKNIAGTVLDEKGNGIAGVAIQVKGTKTGTVSAQDGTFQIQVPDSLKAVLQFSIVGYTTKEVKAKKEKNWQISLAASHATLQEVVVVGHSAMARKSYSASSSIVVPPSGLAYSYASTLTGKIAGVQINGGIAKPNINAGTTVMLRGASTSITSLEIGRKWYGHDSVLQDDEHSEQYNKIIENKFIAATQNPVSTFSIDVDGAAYSNIRRLLNAGSLPPADAVRIEEMINYFNYQHPQPIDTLPFSITMEMADCPWKHQNKLMMVALQAKIIQQEKLPASNLVFLVDVSGSMGSAEKLPLLQQALKLLTDQLRPQDKVTLVAYAGAAGLVLPTTSGANKIAIKEAIDHLSAGGSTAGGQGIELAYKMAIDNFDKTGNNRVILCTDGDFNVGVSSNEALVKLIEDKRQSGVFLSVLGFGTGDYQDGKMQELANKGNGNHAYIDQLSEAKKVLVSEFGGTLFTLAKDVKLQLEFNAKYVAGYRLIGYENRMLNKEDFDDDKKDAGELGSGQTVTAIYEIIPAGVNSDYIAKDSSFKMLDNGMVANQQSNDWASVKFRYKEPTADQSKLYTTAIADKHYTIFQCSDNMQFAASVAGFGLLLRNSQYKGDLTYNQVLSIAKSSRGSDKEGYRKEMLTLVRKAKKIAKDFSEESNEEENPVTAGNY